MGTKSKRLSGKVAVITGASKGIGAAIARFMAAEGASAAVNYSSSKAMADKVVDEIRRNGGKAIAVQANMMKKEDIERMFAETKQAFGRLDILVNNAGIYEFAPIEQVTEENFHRQFDLNVLGLLLACQEAVKHFDPSGGCIINAGSTASKHAEPSTSVYSATKAAVEVISRVLAKELGPRNIRVNTLSPGMVETEGTREAGILESDFRKQTEKHTPLGRIGRPEDIASVAVFLASADAGWLTGQTIYASGGI